MKVIEHNSMCEWSVSVGHLTHLWHLMIII